jgi:Flp pilus assembly protein TadG
MTILSKRNRNLASEEGAVAVEFAIIFPVLILVLFGIFEFGQFFSELEVYESAAREGARAAAVRGSASDIQAAVTSASSPFTVGGTPTADIVCTDLTVGQMVTVSWSQSFQINVPLWKNTTFQKTIGGSFRCE